MIKLVFGFVICIFVTASFVDTQRYNDYEILQDENVMQKLLRILNNSDYNKEKRRNIENALETDDWHGRWMPDRPNDPKPPPKVLPKELLPEMNWPGRWMPERPSDPKPPPKILPKSQQRYEYESIMEFPHEMYMGHVSSECDDAKTNLTIDWDGSPSKYTCYGHNIVPRKLTPKIYCENIPKTYKAPHICMNKRINYDDVIPLYGPHRPLWPVYGEYKYVPEQRWLHSLEHGAIVMLYHPCANPLEVERLKNIVNKCLWRHIITPYSYLNEDRPLALLSWGCKLTMSYVNPTVVKRFIQKKALRGPEKNADNGQFKDGLLSQSSIVSDEVDSMLCSNM
ncbi:hypothetical protein PUN28_006298 [Cardiocondyla obscurior]|uniref:Uncharacterized protein n=1 Tax=Cardiocondyla obscurior TaxID=286306 RepID=A0AAW2GAX7_9HYME